MSWMTKGRKALAKVSKLLVREPTRLRRIIAPGIPASELMALRAHIDEAKDDPDYDVVISYECHWDD